MAESADAETPPTRTALGEPELEQELNHSQTESGGSVLLRLLGFKAHLLEAVEELHLRRDAETRFEDHISKTVLEKQELEWEKESLQHHLESVTNQHSESLSNLKKQFQAKLRTTEEEKGKYQVIAELKGKEINNLKEELKSLQLLKYNLEKKSSELEQKLALQSRTKDSHLNQLGEVEKRFSALSRQCAMVKQAHGKLEQNVDEAMRINGKLTSANEKQEATIVSLKKELDEVSNELTKAKMAVVRQDRPRGPAGGEQQQLLHRKLKLETEMNRRLREENESERAEKQEVIRSLQLTQQLLLSQTQTVRRLELELQTQRQLYKGLKQEHEVMREESKAAEDKVAQLMESYGASKTSWDKERTRFLDRLKNEQEEVRALSEAYDDLHQKHAELSLQAQLHAQHTQEMEVRHSRQTLCVSTQPTRVDEIRGEEPLGEPVYSSELPGLGGLQHSISSQAKSPDRLEDAAAVTKLLATEASEGQKVPKQQSQTVNRPLSQPNTPGCPAPLSSSVSLCTSSGAAATETRTLTRTLNSSAGSESNPDMISDITNTPLSVSDDGDNQLIKGRCVSGVAASGPEHSSLSQSVNLLTNMNNKEGDTGMNERGQEEDGGEQGTSHREEEETNVGQQRDREGVRGEDVKEGGRAGEKRATAVAQTTDRRSRGEDSEGSAKDAETETEDRANGARGGEKTAAHTPQTQIRAQTTADTTAEESHTLQVTDSMDTEPPLDVCEPSDFTQALCQNAGEKDAECKHLSSQCETGREGEHQSGGCEVSRPCHDDDAQSSCRGAESLSCQSGRRFQETTREKPPAEATGDFSAAFSEPEQPLQSQGCSEQRGGQLGSVGTAEGEGDSSACRGGEGQSNVDTNACESVRTPMEKPHLDDDHVNFTVDAVNLESEAEPEHRKTDRMEDAAQAKEAKSGADLKLPLCPSRGHKQPQLGGKLLGDPAESAPPRKKALGPLFDWGAAERKIPNSRATSGVSRARRLIQGSSLSEPNTTGGFPGRPPSTTIPTFLRSKHDNVPSVITRASDLLNAPSVCGTAPSLRRTLQGLWEATETSCRERTAAEMDGRPHLPSCPCPAPASSSKLSRQTTAEWSRAPTSAAGPSSESDRERSCSQHREDQQASFRAQISKIEQILDAEKLRLPKRHRIEPDL